MSDHEERVEEIRARMRGGSRDHLWQLLAAYDAMKAENEGHRKRRKEGQVWKYIGHLRAKVRRRGLLLSECAAKLGAWSDAFWEAMKLAGLRIQDIDSEHDCDIDYPRGTFPRWVLAMATRLVAERDAAVQRAEEAEEVPKHFGDCWWADADGVPHLFDGTTREPCPICRRVLGKGKGEG